MTLSRTWFRFMLINQFWLMLIIVFPTVFHLCALKCNFPHGTPNFWAVNLRLETKGWLSLLTSCKSFTSRYTATNHKLRQTATEQLKVYRWFYRYREKNRFQNKQESLFQINICSYLPELVFGIVVSLCNPFFWSWSFSKHAVI